jgi:hypothetical protein
VQLSADQNVSGTMPMPIHTPISLPKELVANFVELGAIGLMWAQRQRDGAAVLNTIKPGSVRETM